MRGRLLQAVLGTASLSRRRQVGSRQREEAHKGPRQELRGPCKDGEGEGERGMGGQWEDRDERQKGRGEEERGKRRGVRRGER